MHDGESGTYFDIHEFEDSYENIALNSNLLQLERGKAVLLNQNVYLDGLILRQLRISHAVYEEFTIEPGWTTLVLTSASKQAAVWNGLTSKPNVIGILLSDQDHTVSMPAGWNTIEIDINNHLLANEGLLPDTIFSDAQTAEKGQLQLYNCHAETLRNKLLTYINAYHQQTGAAPLDTRALRRYILDQLASALDSGCQNVPASFVSCNKRAYDLVRKACYLLNEQLCDNPSLEMLAKDLGVSTRSLQRCFMRVLGVSPKQYLLAKKLDAARRRMRSMGQHTTVIDTAYQFGFVSSCRFIEQYRQHFGYTPGTILRSNPGKN